MTRIRIACTVAICLLFTAVTFARQTQPAQEEEPKPHANAQQQEPEAKPDKPEKQESPKPEKPEKPEKKEKEKPSKAEGRSTDEQGEHAAQTHAGGKGGHIPDEKFRSNFGRSHTFVINKPVVVNNQPTFQYGGYSFVVVDAWPMGWAYTDNCYIDYVDGEYFLFDLLHPGMRVALLVEM